MKKPIVAWILISMAFTLKAQFFIFGKVYDESNHPITGVSIQLSDSKTGTITDQQGNYRLGPLEKATYQVLVHCLGYADQKQTLEITADTEVNFNLIPSSFLTNEVLVQSTRSSQIARGTTTSVNKQALTNNNLGHDLPYLMSLTPSLVANSDAGTGIGYTSFRIRGTDANRINVTVNGIPLNDAESHGVFWVNMPDFASSVENIEIQRGVGTSTNGAGAFGATVNMLTSQFEQKPFAEIGSAAGSFNTFKNSIKIGSGLLNNHFVVEARLSKITTDGFIDRAFSDLTSWFVTGGYYSAKTMVKLNVFSGKERTYQAWNGVPKVRLENDSAGMARYGEHWLYSEKQVDEMMQSDSRTYNLYTYKNETDNYQQDHYQFFVSHDFGSGFSANAALHYTYGRGYYEQFKTSDNLMDYGINPIVIVQDTITNSDIIRQKWLDNDFYGGIFSFQYKSNQVTLTTGGGINRYDGRHFGKVIWGQFVGNTPFDHEWYRSTGLKTDVNVYQKINIDVNPQLSLFGDAQFRYIHHAIKGIDDDRSDISQEHFYRFFNPKAGINFHPVNGFESYFLYSNGHREPNRSNFTDAGNYAPTPEAESVNDFELGASYKNQWLNAAVNFYGMFYNDQMVLTGKINNVGSPIMTNVAKSYRTGMELSVGVKLFKVIEIQENLTLSQSRIKNFTEFVDNWDTGLQDSLSLGSTPIAFSPNVISNSAISIKALKNTEIVLNNQFVGKQYVDNTGSSDRMLKAYNVLNMRLSYSFSTNWFKQLQLSLMVNNLLNTQYENNAWVYSYIYNGQRWAMDGYFPQAGINFMAGLNLKF